MTATGRALHNAAGYDWLVWIATLGRERSFRERLVRLARLEPGDAVLDIGCGTGTLAIAAKQHVGSTGAVFGIDASVQMIARAGRKARKAAVDVAFQQASADALPFPDARFDVVLSTLMLHHLPKTTRATCVREIRRVLKPAGRLLACDFGTPSHRRRSPIAHFHRHGHVSAEELAGLVSGAGLVEIERGDVGMKDVLYVVAVRPGDQEAQ